MITLTEEQWDVLFSCPEWCTTDHKEVHKDGYRAYHDGPTFGGVGITWTVMDPCCPVDREWSVNVNELHYNSEYSSSEMYSPEEARALLSDLMAASAWLEAHR
jgi:hypothetical protein